jgi:hypothetical protein
VIKSEHSLVKKYVTPELWKKHCGHATKTSGIFFFSKLKKFPHNLDNKSLKVLARHQFFYYKKRRLYINILSGFTLARAIACAVQLDNQHVGIYAGDEDCYVDFKDIYHPIICHYHKLESNFTHKPNMDASEI